ncbi:hypothetical protein [Thermomonospora amylolytica]|uniref:hypothetical protein n=1 Tax=Thermomonospora amylolytica TaxID=1411117 RepID=UPI000E6CC744|nr:hypothetical protein [Thermomonospora amylolytica]
MLLSLVGIAAVIGAVVLYVQYRAQYLESWGERTGAPDGFRIVVATTDASEYFATIEGECSGLQSCVDLNAGESVKNWANGIGFSMDDDVAQCFRFGCNRVITHEGHDVILNIRTAYVSTSSASARYVLTLQMEY